MKTYKKPSKKYLKEMNSFLESLSIEKENFIQSKVLYQKTEDREYFFSGSIKICEYKKYVELLRDIQIHNISEYVKKNFPGREFEIVQMDFELNNENTTLLITISVLVN